jgi:serine/threonine protein kinase
MSRYYRPPELIMGTTRYSVAVDIWAVGCVMAELALLEPIFVGSGEGEQLFAILKIMGSFSP